MASMSATVVPGAEAIAELHAQELPQKDNLCGCFWGAIVLRAAGIADVDQDRVAVEAGTTLPAGDPATFVPRGETPRRDYRIELPVAPDATASGTAAPMLGDAIQRLAEGRLAVVPVAGPWTAETVVSLLETVAAIAPDTTLIANIRTGPLWGSRPDPALLLAYLAGVDVQGPPPEWDTGHYVNLLASVRSAERALVLVRDSYRGLGWQGYHLQPDAAFARALERGDGREGGVLCICPAAGAGALRESLAEAGYDLRDWSNGTPSAPP